MLTNSLQGLRIRSPIHFDVFVFLCNHMTKATRSYWEGSAGRQPEVEASRVLEVEHRVES